MNKKGAAFLTTIILLGIAVAASTAASVMLLKDAFTVKRLKSSAQAYCLAEAGVEEAIQILWSNDFALSQFPINRNLGGGNIVTEIDASKWVTDGTLLIISTGTANSISRLIKVTVKPYTAPDLNYAILAAGKVHIYDTTTIKCGDSIGIHSNSPLISEVFTDNAILVKAAAPNVAVVRGNATAVGGIKVKSPGGSITGSQISGAPAVTLPPFDATFFNYYLNRASGSGNVYTPPNGTQTFDNVTLTPAGGVIYVNGNVSLKGNVNITGCIVATGNIWVNYSTRGSVYQTQVNNLPALMSSGGGIWIWDITELNGLVYAAGDISMFLQGFNPYVWHEDDGWDIRIYGPIMSKGNVISYTGTTLDYVKRVPPGNPIGLILSWQEDSPY